MHEVEARNKPKDLGRTRWPSPWDSFLRSVPLLGVFGLIAAGNFALVALGLTELKRPSATPMVQAFERITADGLPPVAPGGWQRMDFQTAKREHGDILGDYSRTWAYRLGDVRVAISLDYAWSAFHDLKVCYTSTGWNIQEEQNLRELPDHILEVRMTKPIGGAQYGYLLFTNMDEAGQPLALSSGRLVERFLTNSPLFRKQPKVVYQVQLFTETYQPLKPTQIEACRKLYEYARDTLSQYAPNR
jgi:hypothetical protein